MEATLQFWSNILTSITASIAILIFILYSTMPCWNKINNIRIKNLFSRLTRSENDNKNELHKFYVNSLNPFGQNSKTNEDKNRLNWDYEENEENKKIQYDIKELTNDLKSLKTKNNELIKTIESSNSLKIWRFYSGLFSCFGKLLKFNKIERKISKKMKNNLSDLKKYKKFYFKNLDIFSTLVFNTLPILKLIYDFSNNHWRTSSKSSLNDPYTLKLNIINVFKNDYCLHLFNFKNISTQNEDNVIKLFFNFRKMIWEFDYEEEKINENDLKVFKIFENQLNRLLAEKNQIIIPMYENWIFAGFLDMDPDKKGNQFIKILEYDFVIFENMGTIPKNIWSRHEVEEWNNNNLITLGFIRVIHSYYHDLKSFVYIPKNKTDNNFVSTSSITTKQLKKLEIKYNDIIEKSKQDLRFNL